MKYFIFFIAGLLIIAGAAYVAYSSIMHKSQPASTTTNTNPFGSSGYVGNPGSAAQNPSSGQGNVPAAPAATAALTGADGTPIAVHDFSNDPDLLADPYNAGIYSLGYHPFDATSSPATPNAPYYIEYQAPTQMFVISLNQEPISQTRQQAEQYLMAKLGITQDQMCNLRYSLAVPSFVNDLYAGENLGFSFCPGAVQLAQ